MIIIVLNNSNNMPTKLVINENAMLALLKLASYTWRIGVIFIPERKEIDHFYCL